MFILSNAGYYFTNVYVQFCDLIWSLFLFNRNTYFTRFALFTRKALVTWITHLPCVQFIMHTIGQYGWSSMEMIIENLKKGLLAG